MNHFYNYVFPIVVYYSAKFIERKHWLVTGDGNGYIHVYNYYTMEEVRNFKAHDSNIMSLAVHPSSPFVLSASDDHLVKLWDWDNRWKCLQTFRGHYDRVTQVIFNPVFTNSFATASLDGRLKV
jgi:coatomer subunit beta'